MRILKIFFLSMGFLSLLGCAVKAKVSNEYQLSKYSAKQYAAKSEHITLLITAPDAVAGYQTDEMLYTNKPFKVESFAKNAWTSPPAEMLYPLMTQSLERSGYFHAVATSAYSEAADYRLDTQLLSLQQNFLKKPSTLEFAVKIVLTNVNDNKVLASRIISQQIPCPMDTPYGGVLAANKATEHFTATTTNFVLSHIKHEHQYREPIAKK